MFNGQRGSHLLEFFRNLTPQALFFGCAVYFAVSVNFQQFSLVLSDIKQTILVFACGLLWLLSVAENGLRFLKAYLKEDQHAAAVWASLEKENHPSAEVFLRLFKDGWKHNKRWFCDWALAFTVVWAALVPMTMLAYQSAVTLYKISIESSAPTMP